MVLIKNSLTLLNKLTFVKLKQQTYNNILRRAQPYTTTTCNLGLKMEDSNKGRSLQDVLNTLESFAPLKYAESWDNVGLLVDANDNTAIKTIMLTNDLTESVLKEAVGFKTDLIITYHPNIFHGLKSVSNKTWKEKLVLNCIRNNISVFSPHTSWDAIKGGVNDWLASAFDAKISKPIKENPENPSIGCGRIVTLQNKITVKDAVERIKSHIKLPHVRLALAKEKDESDTISTVALCAGSGSFVLNGVQADLYLTGEMMHHDILDATQKNIHVVLCNHSDSERGFLQSFSKYLANELKNDVQVLVSKTDKDPLKTV